MRVPNFRDGRDDHGNSNLPKSRDGAADLCSRVFCSLCVSTDSWYPSQIVKVEKMPSWPYQYTVCTPSTVRWFVQLLECDMEDELTPQADLLPIRLAALAAVGVRGHWTKSRPRLQVPLYYLY